MVCVTHTKCSEAINSSFPSPIPWLFLPNPSPTAPQWIGRMTGQSRTRLGKGNLRELGAGRRPFSQEVGRGPPKQSLIPRRLQTVFHFPFYPKFQVSWEQTAKGQAGEGPIWEESMKNPGRWARSGAALLFQSPGQGCSTRMGAASGGIPGIS